MAPFNLHVPMPVKEANRHIFWTLMVVVVGLFLFALYRVFIKEAVPVKKVAVDPFLSHDFVDLDAGSFSMGSDASEAFPDEQPVHKAVITHPFAIGKSEVTQAQWSTVMDHNPSLFPNPDHPVDNVDWGDIQIFLNKLNIVAACENCYRLPTEAEWEYAARAGTDASYSFGESPDSLGSHAWYAENAGFTTHPVRTKMPNAWGLYDMLGNVYEWTQDFYGPYEPATKADPRGATVGTKYVLRGGSWTDGARELRVTHRDYYAPTHRHNFFGFRLVRTIPFEPR